MGHIQHLSESGHKIPSVSEIPSIFAKHMDGFEDWICKQEHSKDDRCCTRAKRKYYTEQADLGNDIHALLEAYLRGEKFEEGVPEYHAAVLDPIIQFLKDSGYKPLEVDDNGGPVHAIELPMTGKEVGGTLDGAGTFSIPFWEKQRKTFWDKTINSCADAGVPLHPPTAEDVWIMDLKIKSKLDVLHPLQLYGYSLLLKEVYDIDAKWGLIIRREKKLDRKPELQLKGYYLPAYKAQWEASMLMWKFLNGGE